MTPTAPESHSRHGAAQGDDSAALLLLLREWSDAFVKRDMATLDRVRADDWTYSGDPSGELITKAQADRNFRADPTRFLAFDYEDVAVRVYRDVALLTARQIITFESGGKVSKLRLRLSNVFVKRDGLWRAVSSHTTPIE